ncbi:MAG TPA: HTH domain-containing protein, partial [Gammaproteobacteria bacterium]|nr:HTH domain-containing protein [Gammaproteobacteria bacterium]
MSPPIAAFGGRQRALLASLLEEKQGLSADELAERLEISRSAVHQHAALLERDGYLEKIVRPPQGGRPSHAWRLTDEGIDLFPKNYALFSDLMIRALKKSLGSEGLTRILEGLGTDIARSYAPRLHGRPLAEQIEIVSELMAELGYQTHTLPDPDARGRPPIIDARNCVYHHLAREHSEVCELDLAL